MAYFRDVVNRYKKERKTLDSGGVMELIKQKVHMNHCNSRKEVTTTIDTDYNVPDIKPDARSIMQEREM